MDIHRFIAPALHVFRSRRMKLFESLIQPTPATRVLDVGGTPFNWQYCKTKPHVTLLNVEHGLIGKAGLNADIIIADGCSLPFRDGSFDVVFCNSVIEHLRVSERQAQLASEIRRVGRSYFVQTPNRWFPVEPHFLAPGFHFLPRRVRRALARNFTLWGLIARPSQQSASALVDEISLLERYGHATSLSGRARHDGETGWPAQIDHSNKAELDLDRYGYVVAP